MSAVSTEHLADLPAAIADGTLRLFYQPQVTAGGKKIAAVEALVRWNHPKAGWIPPSILVPYAEAEGLIGALGLWALRRACQDALLWPGVSVAVNISPRQFENPKLVDDVLSCLAAAGVESSRIELEVTEGTVFDDFARAERTLQEFRRAGMGLALDDFGTGYSSLSVLRRMPWTKVKIDQSFTKDVAHLTSAAIVHATVALARAIGLRVTAEGVETEEQQKFCKLAGCHLLQGYRFSKAVPAAEMSSLMQGWEGGERKTLP